MAEAAKLNVTIEPELAAQVRGAVASGDYASASDVVADALRSWSEQRHLHADPDTLRRLWDEGNASGEAEPHDMAEIKRAARARLLKDMAGES